MTFLLRRFLLFSLLLLLAATLGFPPQFRAQVSPRWLGKLLGAAGPLLTWLPLALLPAPPPAKAPSPDLPRALLLSICAWLALIPPIHLLRRLLPLDPSGHIFLYGAQLVPLWVALEGAQPRPALPLQLLELALLALSAATAAWYHSKADVLAAWAALACLVAAVRSRAPALARPGRRALLGAVALWAALGCALLGAVLARGGRLPRSLPARAAHDALVAGAGLWLSGRAP